MQETVVYYEKHWYR